MTDHPFAVGREHGPVVHAACAYLADGFAGAVEQGELASVRLEDFLDNARSFNGISGKLARRGARRQKPDEGESGSRDHRWGARRFRHVGSPFQGACATGCFMPGPALNSSVDRAK